METNTGSTWNASQYGCIAAWLSVTAGVAISLWQNERQSGRGQLSACNKHQKTGGR